MKIHLLLSAVMLTASVGASSFRPSNNHAYLSSNVRANLSKHDAILTKDHDELDVASIATATEECKSALSTRGGGVGTNVDIPQTNAVVGTVLFTLMQIVVNKIFVGKGIVFPAMLACTILVFVGLVLTEAVAPGTGDNAFEQLTPGADLLTKWLPVMFVPGLALLPLAPSIGSASDVVKALTVVVLGFFYSMGTTAFVVQFVRKCQGLIEEKVEEPVDSAAVTTEAPPPKPKPFTDETYKFLLQGTVLSGAISMAATRQSNSYATPLRTLFMFFGTFFTYVASARLPASFNKIVHPLITGTAGTLLLTKLDALVTGSSFEDVLKTYKQGSLSPSKAGAGDLLVFLLGPAIACLGVPMYSRKKIMADNLPAVIAGMLCSSAGGLFGTAWYCRLMSIGSSTVSRMSLLPRNVTTGLAIVITEILGGNISIACVIVVLTGIFGATVGRAFLDFLKIDDPVSRGLGMGGSGQGLGVTAMLPEKEAFPFAVINMVLTGVCTTALVSIPAVREMVLNIVSAGLEEGTA